MTTLNEYSCHAFHSNLVSGKSSGTMHIHENQVVFTIKSENITFPLADIEVKAGGASNRLVFFQHASQPDWTFYTSDRSVLNHAFLNAHSSVSPLLMKAKKQRAVGWIILACVCAAIVLMPLAMILNMDHVSAVVAKKVPIEWEQKLGASSLAQYRINKEFLDDKQAQKLLDPLTERLVAALPNSRYSYRFYIVHDASINAFALPGGEVVIHSSLILHAESAEELLGVLAHEITHVEAQHGIRNVIGSAGLYVIAGAIFGDVNGILAVAAGAAPLLLNQRYSRGFETESDIEGFNLLQRANIDPRGLASFFDKLMKEEKSVLDSIEDSDTRRVLEGALGFLSTHPASEERIQKLQILADEIQVNHVYTDLSDEFITVQQYVKEFVTNNEINEGVDNEN